MSKSPARAFVWLLVAVLALWTTNYENLQNRNHDGFHRQVVSPLGGILAEAHPVPIPSPPPSYNRDLFDTDWDQATADETRAFIESIFTAKALRSFGIEFSAARSENLVNTVTEGSPVAGRYEDNQIYINAVLKPLREVLVDLPAPIVDKIVVDGEWAGGS